MLFFFWGGVPKCALDSGFDDSLAKNTKKKKNTSKNKKQENKQENNIPLFFFLGGGGFSEMCLGLRIWRQSCKKNKKKHTMDYCFFW